MAEKYAAVALCACVCVWGGSRSQEWSRLWGRGWRPDSGILVSQTHTQRSLLLLVEQ